MANWSNRSPSTKLGSSSNQAEIPSPSSSGHKRKGSPIKVEWDPFNQRFKRRMILEGDDPEGSEVIGTYCEADPVHVISDVEEFIKKEPQSEPSPVDKNEHSYSISVDNTMSRCRSLLNKVSELLQRKPTLTDERKLKKWNLDVADLREKTTKPAETTIAVVGDTGAGKSSLINALLDHADILPTSSWRACTAVVVEVTGNISGDEYEADIEFLSEKEWCDELSSLRSNLEDLNGNIKVSKRDPKSDAGVALSKVRAVYGPLEDGTNWEEYTKKNRVTEHLGQPAPSIKTETPEEFRKQIEYYIQSTGKEEGGEFWPVIRNVRIRIPHCDICRDGAVLVDLPGTRDSNEARNQIAENYVKNCSSMWVVANINRATDDKAAKDMLRYSFDDDAWMDGHYRCVSFICTHADQIRTREIMSDRNISLPEEDELMHGRIREKECFIKNLTRECKALESSIKSLKREIENPDNPLSKSQKKEELRQKEDELERKIAEKSEEDNKVKSDKRNLKLACIKARSNYCTTKITRDFRERLRSMKGASGMPNEEEEDIDEYTDTEEDIDDPEENPAQNLQVFCVSALEYLRMKGLIEDEDLPQIMDQEDDTEIPRLRNFVHELTLKRQRQEEEELIRNLRSLVEDIWGYLDRGGSIRVYELRQQAKPTYNILVKELGRSLGQLNRQLKEQLNHIIDNQLITKLKEGAGTAAAEAENTHLRWGSKGDRGYAWNTYRTVCQRDGQYRSHKFGEINFNKELAEPMYSSISETWDKLFHESLGKIFGKYQHSVLNVVRKFGSSLREKLEDLDMCDDQVGRCCQRHLNITDNTLIRSLNELNKLIEVRKKDIGRVLTEKVKDGMQPAYNECKKQVGGGMYGRMKEHMGRHIRTEKINIFHQSPEAMIQEIKSLQNKISAHLQECIDTLMTDTRRVYKPFWEIPKISQTLVEDYLAEAVQCKRMVEKLCEEANIPDVRLTKSPSNRAVETPSCSHS